MKNPVKSLCGGALFVAALCAVGVFSTGCEWESSDDDGTWNDSMSWANFSGLYRSGDGSRALVSNFSLSSGGSGGTEGGSDGDVVEHAVAAEAGPLKPGLFSTAEGIINFTGRGSSGWSLKPGSVNISFVSGSSASVGSVADAGNGILSGSFSQAAGGETFSVSGTINYDTGAWSLTLEVAFLGPAQFTYSYVILERAGTSADPDAGGEDSPTSHGWVYTLQIEQTGNRLTFTDNRGFAWSGRLSMVSTPAGDSTGRSPGDVVGSFEVRGVTDKNYRITGTFSGSYGVTTPEGDVPYGQLTARRIQGIWMEPVGNGDLYGVANDGAQVAVTTE